MNNSLHIADNIYKDCLLECINEWYIIMLYHTMTVLLEYIDHSLQFPQTLNPIMRIMLNAFNDPLCSKLCWSNRVVPI